MVTTRLEELTPPEWTLLLVVLVLLPRAIFETYLLSRWILRAVRGRIGQPKPFKPSKSTTTTEPLGQDEDVAIVEHPPNSLRNRRSTKSESTMATSER